MLTWKSKICHPAQRWNSLKRFYDQQIRQIFVSVVKLLRKSILGGSVLNFQMLTTEKKLIFGKKNKKHSCWINLVDKQQKWSTVNL